MTSQSEAKVKFRPHAMGMLLDESMERVVELDATREAVEAFIKGKEADVPFAMPTITEIEIEAYGFDKRINWDTQLVVVYYDDGMHWVRGYLSGPVANQ